jgi:indole-3-glycerol phosphate synthase
MASLLGSGRPLIAESGIDDPAQVNRFQAAGFEGFLIGEQFMKSPDPGKALHTFVTNLNFPV